DLLRFALLPGSGQAYRYGTRRWDERSADESRHVPLLPVAGRMAAVASSSTDRRRAQGFVVWLAGSDVSQQVAPHSLATTLVSQSQMAGAGRWTGSLGPAASHSYTEALAQSLTLPRALTGVVLPGRADYLAALDRAVHATLSGEKTAAAALSEAAKRWREIT